MNSKKIEIEEENQYGKHTKIKKICIDNPHLDLYQKTHTLERRL